MPSSVTNLVLPPLLFGLASAQPAADPCVDHSTTVEEIAVAMESRYIYPAKGARAARLLRADAAAGRFIEVCGTKQEQAKQLQSFAREVLFDKHMVVYFDEGQSGHAPEEPDPDYLAANLGFDEVSRLPDGIAYIKVSSWGPGHWTVRRLPHIIELLRASKGIVIDLRGNGGGDGVTTNYFIRSFLPKDTPATLRHFDRDGAAFDFDYPEISWEPVSSDIPIAVLIDGESGSASEAVAFSLREEGRATIFGTRSAGAAHHIKDTVKLNGGFIIFVPEVRGVGRLSGEDWEGTGVVPDVYAHGEAAVLRAWSQLRDQD